MFPPKAKVAKIQSIATTSVETASTPTPSTVTSLTGGQAIQQQITIMQHQQEELRKQHQQEQLVQEQKEQLQTLLEIQKGLIVTSDTEEDPETSLEELDDHILQSDQDILPDQLLEQPKNQLENFLNQKCIITKNETQIQQDQLVQEHKNQLQHLLEMQKRIIMTSQTQPMQQFNEHHIFQSNQESLPVTILRTTSQNIGINTGIPIRLAASTDQHSIVY